MNSEEQKDAYIQAAIDKAVQKMRGGIEPTLEEQNKSYPPCHGGLQSAV